VIAATFGLPRASRTGVSPSENCAHAANSAPSGVRGRNTATSDGNGAEAVLWPNRSRPRTKRISTPCRKPNHGTIACQCGPERAGRRVLRRMQPRMIYEPAKNRSSWEDCRRQRGAPNPGPGRLLPGVIEPALNVLTGGARIGCEAELAIERVEERLRRRPFLRGG